MMNIENIIYISLVVILIVILIIFVMYNKLIKLLNKVKKAKANIEIYINKRFDLIPNLVECVKGYSNHESSTLEDIVALRSNYDRNKNSNINQVGRMNERLNKYLAIVENYPELKANQQYLDLQNKLSQIEDELQHARHIYNNEVTKYNTVVESIPSNIVASIFAFKKASLFEAEEHKRENIKLNF